MQFGDSAIACLAQVGEHSLAVSIQPDQTGHRLPSATYHTVTHPRGIYIVDTNESTVKAVLDAHTDTVQCICPLPGGDGILSAGGKMDATVRVWDTAAITDSTESSDSDEVKVLTEAKIMKQPGYVFDLKVLPDSNGSAVYAIAAARYNVIKIII